MNQISEVSPSLHHRLRVFLPVLICLLTFFVLGLLLLPYGVQWYLGDWLRDRGVVNVSIGNVDINPFTGVFSVQSLEYEDQGVQRRAGFALANLSWTDLMNRRIRLTLLELRDAELEIRRTETNRWLLGTIVLGAQEAVEGAEQREVESGWGFGIDQLRFEQVVIDYRDPVVARNFVIDELSVDDVASWDPAQATSLAVALSSGAARLSTSGDMHPFADTFDLLLQVDAENLDAAGYEALLQQVGIESVSGLLHTDFQIKVLAPPDMGTSITVNGSVELDDLAVSSPVGRLALADLEWDGNMNVRLNDDTDAISAEGKLQLVEMALASASASVELQTMGWVGSIVADLSEQDDAVVLEGLLSADGFGFNDTAHQLAALLGSLQWRGRAATASQNDWRLDAAGEIIAEQISAGYEGTPKMLGASALRAELADMAPGERFSLRAVEIAGLNLIERVPSEAGDDAHLLSLAKIEIDGISLTERTLDVGQVLLSDAQLWLERAADGVLETDALLAAGNGVELSSEIGEETVVETSGTDQNSEALASAGAGIAFSLAGVKTVGDSRLMYVDHSVKPMVRLALTPFEIEIGKVDAANPDSDTPIRFAASQGRYGAIAFAGELRPLAEKTVLNGAGTVKDLNMIMLNGFARRAIGYVIESGTLSADVEVDLQGQQLDSSAALTIRRLEMDPLKADEHDEFSTELGVPLGTALGLLEDDQETIRLTFPVQGDLADLSVGVGDAVRLVVRKGLVAGMQTAATTYFAPLWPTLAATKLFAAASKLSFRAVVFTPGEKELGAEQLTYVENMAGLLAKRPKVSLSLCGRAVAADASALFPDAAGELGDAQLAALIELSQQRHQAVKDSLVDAGIESARLVTCTPEAQLADMGLPRVDFGV